MTGNHVAITVVFAIAWLVLILIAVGVWRQSGHRADRIHERRHPGAPRG